MNHTGFTAYRSTAGNRHERPDPGCPEKMAIESTLKKLGGKREILLPSVFHFHLRGEKYRERHMADLVLQFLDAVDMRVLVPEDMFQDLPGRGIA